MEVVRGREPTATYAKGEGGCGGRESGLRAVTGGQLVLPKEQGSLIPLHPKTGGSGVGDACLVQAEPANREL